MSEYWQRVRSFSPSLRRLMLAAVCMLSVWSGLMAVLYNLYLVRLGFDARTIGLLGGLGALVWGLAALPAGLLSNRIGLRNSLQLGGVLYGLGVALTLLVEQLPQAQWQAWLLGSGVVMNIGIAFAMVNAAPYIMAVTKEFERPHAFAIMAALSPLAAFFGSVLTGVLPGLLARGLGLALDQPDPYRLAMWVGPLLCWLGMIPMLGADPGRVVHDTGERSDAEGGGRVRAPLGLLAFWALVVFLEAVGEGSVRMFFNVLMDTGLHVPTATIGLVMGTAQLLPIGVALALPLLLGRWGTGYTLLRGIFALAACLCPFALGARVGTQADGWLGWAVGLIIVAYLALAATMTVLGTARDMFGQEIVVARWRTSSQGVAMLGLAFGLSAAGVVGGALIEAFGFGALYLTGALAALAAAGLLLGYLQRGTRRRSGPALDIRVAHPPTGSD
ncbi:MAG: MFS transporter [Caldilineaceae bacterium]